MANSVTCNKSVSINKLIDHLFSASKEFFLGTAYEDDFFVYHDALSLITSANSQAYCNEKGYRLILPQLDLNKGTIYENRPIGNIPWEMPMDAHLNQDVHQSVDHHVLLTQHLPDNDERKFSKRTPKLMARAYKKIYDPKHGPNAGAPVSARIIQDINRVIDTTYLAIFRNRGRSLDNAAYNKGRRYAKLGKNWGGKRVKKDFDRENGPWVHSDVGSLKNELIMKAKERSEDV